MNQNKVKNFRTGRNADTSAFSRADLFIMIFTLAVLAMTLFPALARVHVNARDGQCLNNLRQLTAAWWMYVNDNEGKLCPLFRGKATFMVWAPNPAMTACALDPWAKMSDAR